jgi:competence protein ComEC
MLRIIKYMLILSAVLLPCILGGGCQYLALDKQLNVPGPTQQPFRVSFLDVGQGDAVLIEADDEVMMIDAGGNDQEVVLIDMLVKMGIEEIDILVGTHPHEDHIGGMDRVIERFETGKIFMPNVTHTTATFRSVMQSIKNSGLKISDSAAGSSHNLGSATWEIIAPNSGEYEDLNNYSIVIRLVYEGTAFLFTGDCEIESEAEMLDAGWGLDADVLKISHHGSSSSNSKEFLEAVSPEYGVICVGEDNPYGHPHQEVLERLDESDIRIYRTDMDGTVVFTSDGSNLEIETWR